MTRGSVTSETRSVAGWPRCGRSSTAAPSPAELPGPSASYPRAIGAELVGTGVLVGIGTGTLVVGAAIGGLPLPIVAVAWFVAVTVPVLLVGSTSGAHLNPAITLAHWLTGAVGSGRAATFMVVQALGAIGASVVVATLFGRGGHLGATLPTGVSDGVAWIAEAVATFALALGVLLAGRWAPRPPGIDRFVPGTIVALAILVIGPATGCSLNPARSLGPAVVSGDVTALWIYLTAPLGGAALAAGVARIFGRRRPIAPQNS